MKYLILAATIISFWLTVDARAQGNPDAAKGIAVQICVNCHEVPIYDAPDRRARSNAPAFQAIANDPKTYTEERLRTFLRQPHYPMKAIKLSRSNIDDLVAFIRTLRTN